MKKLLSVLICFVSIFAVGCTSTPQNQTSNITQDEGKGAAIVYDMPSPFGEKSKNTGGADQLYFYQPCVAEFDGISASLIDLVGSSAEEWINESADMSKITSINDYHNLYSFIKTFNPPKEKVMECFEEQYRLFEELNEDFDRTTADIISEEELELIYSGTIEEVTAMFSTDFSMANGERIYSPYWIYSASVDDYFSNSIDPMEAMEKIRLSDRTYNLTDEAIKAICDKILVYAIELAEKGELEGVFEVPQETDIEIPQSVIEHFSFNSAQ